MGVGTILRARKIVLMAWGENKADVVGKAVEGPETEAVSASFLQSHGDATERRGARFFVDERRRRHWRASGIRGGSGVWNGPTTPPDAR